ncbi:MAG: XdhC family protein [Rhodobacteraceae bacterium]|nr:XdhC family protein [Paracoccaceae bacterium]TVR45967.1 MAG: XdhC family protein [Paracoccaceae bacterium]
MPSLTAHPLDIALAWTQAGRGVALATVIKAWGSAPRKPGAHMVIDDQGAFEGSVSGGCVEGAVIAEAADVIAQGTSRMLDFDVPDAMALRAGLSCGGHIRIHLMPLAPMLPVLPEITQMRAARNGCVLITDLSTGASRVVGADPADPLAAPIATCLTTGKAQSEGPIFLNPLLPALRLFIIGAVHIAQSLAPMARQMGLEVIVIDPRSAFATNARLPDTWLVTDWPDIALTEMPPDRWSALAALSHEPNIDDPALIAALRADCLYVGALGSRKTHAARLDRLHATGLSAKQTARIHAPIGLPIGATTPPEIALATLAQIIAARRGAPAVAGGNRPEAVFRA